MIGLHDDVQERIFEEMNDIFGTSERSATFRDLNEMKYLERVIKETLRIYPSVPNISRKINEDIEIGKTSQAEKVNFDLKLPLQVDIKFQKGRLSVFKYISCIGMKGKLFDNIKNVSI